MKNCWSQIDLSLAAELRPEYQQFVEKVESLEQAERQAIAEFEQAMAIVEQHQNEWHTANQVKDRALKSQAHYNYDQAATASNETHQRLLAIQSDLKMQRTRLQGMQQTLNAFENYTTTAPAQLLAILELAKRQSLRT